MKIVNKTYKGILLLIVMLSNITVLEAKHDDIIIIIYTSNDGRTGHVGVAVDNYDFFVTEGSLFGEAQYDSIKNNSLTYFDLWGPDKINWNQHNHNFKGRYYMLPESSSSEIIDLNYLLTEGIPHRYSYPGDAIVRIKTSTSQDFEFKKIIEKVRLDNPYYNTRKFNCADYVIESIERLFNVDFINKEFIPFFWSSTPNSFYKELIQKLNVEIINDPGEKVQYSFLRERIFKSL